MLYFKQITCDNLSTDTIENAIRHYSSKRHTSLDFKDSSSYITDDNYFLGLEGENDLKITRIRTLFESFLPKLIISFPKERHFEIYRIRYSLPSTIVFCVLLFGVLLSIFQLLVDKEIENDYLLLIGIFILFIVLTLLEIKLTKQKINRAINRFNKPAINA